MNDTEKLNWLLNQVGHTRGDLDKAIELDGWMDDIVADIKIDGSDSHQNHGDKKPIRPLTVKKNDQYKL